MNIVMIRRRLPICLLLGVLSAFCLSVSGCRSTSHGEHSSDSEQHSEHELHDLDELIRELNGSRKRNVEARAKLIEMGEHSMSCLMMEFDLREEDHIHEFRMDRATRALRVIRLKGQNPIALESCRWLLLESDIREKIPSLNALYSEAIGYLGDNFDELEARKIYLEFVKEHSVDYLEQTYLKTHWRAGRRADLLRVDILANVLLLSRVSDEMFTELLTELVKIISEPAYAGSALHRLAGDCYTIKTDPRDERGLQAILLRFMEEDRANEVEIRPEPGLINSNESAIQPEPNPIKK